MCARIITFVTRSCLGILLILNGPANALAICFVSTQSACPCASNAQSGSDQGQGGKKCCGRCGRIVKVGNTARNTPSQNNSNKIRPTCPVCPSCPNFPNGCCVSCPCKVPYAPPLVFMMPESAELVWRLADIDNSLSDSHEDELILPPRFSQFVAFTI
jgi:hypothetical protein